MTARRTLASLFVATLLTASPALAQQRAPRVATVDTSRVFNDMAETKALRERMESERQRLQQTDTEKKAELEKLRQQRTLLKPDHPQYEELNKQMMQKAMEYEVWNKYAKLDAERSQKKQMRTLFAHIEGAVAEVAKQQGIDIVLTKQTLELPESLEQISVDQLRMLLNGRQVLYSSEAADISNAVIAALDAKFKGGAGAAPAPAGQ